MKTSPTKGSSRSCFNCACQYSLRHILLLFVFLLVLVVINFLASTSRLSLVVDVSMRVKSNVLDAFKGLTEFGDEGEVNSTFMFRNYNAETTAHGIPIQPTLPNDDRPGVLKENEVLDTSRKELSKNERWFLSDGTLNLSEIKLRMKADNFPMGEDTDSTQDDKNNTKYNFSSNHDPVSSKAEIKSSTSDWRKDTCDMCFKHNFNYVIDNPDVCKLTSFTQKIDIIVVILTQHSNYKARNAIRETWLSPYVNNTGNIRYVFLLGEVHDAKQRELVSRENDVYHDVIKEDFVDSYRNLTYKTIMGFKWVATKCNHARFVFKTDDDMFVNLNNLLNVVNKQEIALQTAVMGSCNLKAKPIRNKSSKWYASFTSYPNSHYPGFCSGTGYVTSMNVAQKVYEISPKIPFFHLEDVYVALCVRKLGCTFLPTKGFLANRRRLDACGFKGVHTITVHQLSPLMLRMIWRRPCSQRMLNMADSMPMLKSKMQRNNVRG